MKQKTLYYILVICLIVITILLTLIFNNSYKTYKNETTPETKQQSNKYNYPVKYPVQYDGDVDYAYDYNVRSLYNDTHDMLYLSKPIKLAVPANSIKVILTASRNNTNDIRVLYQLFRDDSPENILGVSVVLTGSERGTTRHAAKD